MKNINRLLSSRLFLIISTFLSIGGLLLLQACNNNTTNINQNGPGYGKKGKVFVKMTDSPTMNVQALNVSVKEIEIHKAGADTNGWQIISDSTQTINILKLANGKNQLLGSDTLASGTYNQLRLILGSKNTVTVKGNTIPIAISSGVQTGIKINTDIKVTGGNNTNILLDFNAAQSVHMTGNNQFMLNPVIRPVNMKMDGYIKGLIQPSSFKTVILAMNNKDTTSTFTDSTGHFKVMGLKPGSYSLSVNPVDTSYTDTTLNNVKVTSQDTTNIGTVSLKKK